MDKVISNSHSKAFKHISSDQADLSNTSSNLVGNTKDHSFAAEMNSLVSTSNRLIGEDTTISPINVKLIVMSINPSIKDPLITNTEKSTSFSEQKLSNVNSASTKSSFSR